MPYLLILHMYNVVIGLLYCYVELECAKPHV